MRKLLRHHPRFFLIATLAALALRLLFLLRFPAITSDSFIYGDIAKNWLQHGIYGLSAPDGPAPTFLRLPGYPAFLAAIFAVFGMEHYRAVLVLQILLDIGTCFLIADLARRLVPPRAAMAAFLLAALCPFLANYAAAALTETLEIFFTVLAFEAAVIGLSHLDAGKLRPWIACGLAVAACILLRPDGGLLLISLAVYLGWILLHRARVGQPHWPVMRAGLIVSLLALAPLVPWTLRNLHSLHRAEVLAPRYATEENEVTPVGFNRWTRTWIVDYASTEEVYWSVPGSTIDPDKLPARAFDSLEENQQTRQLISDYNDVQHLTPELDARFAALAEQRIRQKPLRYYLWLPILRSADMWLRPRTEILPSDTRWWEFNDDPRWSALAVIVGIIGLLYVALALLGWIRGGFLPETGLLLAFLVLRTLFLSTIENPEPRYTLECYPVILILAATVWRGHSCPREPA